MPTLLLPTGPLEIQDSTDLVSDTKHTFGELYEHRTLLFITLLLLHPNKAWIARFHHDGSNSNDMFLAGIQLPSGQITYHIPNSFLPLLESKITNVYDYAPVWDGHTSEDTLERLMSYISEF